MIEVWWMEVGCNIWSPIPRGNLKKMEPLQARMELESTGWSELINKVPQTQYFNMIAAALKSRIVERLADGRFSVIEMNIFPLWLF